MFYFCYILFDQVIRLVASWINFQISEQRWRYYSWSQTIICCLSGRQCSAEYCWACCYCRPTTFLCSWFRKTMCLFQVVYFNFYITQFRRIHVEEERIEWRTVRDPQTGFLRFVLNRSQFIYMIIMYRDILKTSAFQGKSAEKSSAAGTLL